MYTIMFWLENLKWTSFLLGFATGYLISCFVTVAVTIRLPAQKHVIAFCDSGGFNSFYTNRV
jgi:hypothetical protein